MWGTLIPQMLLTWELVECASSFDHNSLGIPQMLPTWKEVQIILQSRHLELEYTLFLQSKKTRSKDWASTMEAHYSLSFEATIV